MDTEKTVIDEYINNSNESAREKLNALRSLILDIVPSATEKISWSMPTFYYNGNLVHIAAHKNHVGFYAGDGETVALFADELKGYKLTKSCIQIPLDGEIPKDVITKIVKLRAAQNMR